ncbi:hypothetical protein HDU76_005723 [Blyttiomyces sp. JEL0837]|nr:hypothetical protein HDU76_005723 [Blyttiomyces sp. JEL0837]
MRLYSAISIISLLLAVTTFTNVQSAPIALPGGTPISTTEIPTIDSSVLDIPTITPTTTTAPEIPTSTATPVITDLPSSIHVNPLFEGPEKGHSYIFLGNELGHEQETMI